LFNRYIAGKIVVPFLALVLILAILATHITINLIAGSLEEKYREELAQAGRSAGEAMVTLEDKQLALLRQMAFTTGVAEALLQRDPASLEDLLAPIAINQRVAYVDVVAADGTQLLALRDPDIENAAEHFDPGLRSWAPVARVLNGDADAVSDRFADVVSAPWGDLFTVAAPVRRGGALAGAVVVSVPLRDVSSQLSQQAGSKGITLYAPNGTVLASTIRSAPAALQAALAISPTDTAPILSSRNTTIRRSSVVGLPYVEALSALPIRGQPSLVIGVGNFFTMIQESGEQTRNLMILLFSAVMIIVAVLGFWITQLIRRPMRNLVAGTQRIRKNELNFELPVETADETGHLTSAFNEMTEGLRQRERSRLAIERYMSPKVYQLIQAGELKMGGVQREITVLKTDIRGFTTISELLEPEALVSFLNSYFERIVAPIKKYDGEIDKYMGDAVLAKFGATEWYPDHARRAVLAMIEMIEACDAFAAELRFAGMDPIKMGIGANTGTAVVGNIGSPDRMEFTIISDAVNTAQRIEELCKELNWDLLISEQTYRASEDAVEVGEPWSIQLRGQGRATLVYPVLGRKNNVPIERMRAYQALSRDVAETLS